MTATKTPKLLVFGFDAAEAAQIRRMRSYQACGFEIQAFMMRRDNMNSDFQPFWPNVHLYRVANESMTGRIKAMAGSVGKVWKHRDLLRGTDVIVARNLDMLAIAAAARNMIRPRPPLIYECLDIHTLMTDSGPKGRVFRTAERALLRQVSGLIVSSPAFLRNYFEPVQGWSGPTALIENKLWIEPGGPDRPTSVPDRDGPLRVGWVGTLRCARSLKILAETARRLGDQVRIEMYGAVHYHAVPDFDAVVAAHPNIAYHGAYAYPDDLSDIYQSVDMVWSQDLWQWGTNSTWLLPNRIYEASYFGCPSVAVAASETGRRVADGLGWTIPEPSADRLVALLSRLTPQEVQDQRARLLAMPAQKFRQSPEEIRDAILMPFQPGTFAPAFG